MTKLTCSITGCTRPHIARGWCTMHYRRWKKHGDPHGMPKVDVKSRLLVSILINADNCWVWQGKVLPGRGRGGDYGQITVNGEARYAHRVAYETWVGPIPKDYEIDHVAARGCKSTLCINPDHLEAVTRKENYARSRSLGVINAEKTHCHRGHPFDESNTYRLPNTGHRVCRACAKDRERRKSDDPEWRAYRAACKRRLRART